MKAEGKPVLGRKRGRPRTTWTRTEEIRSVGIGWERAARLAKDRAIWRDLVDALCPIRSQLFIACMQAVGCRVEKTGTRNEVAIMDSRG